MKMKQKSKADILIERLDKELVKNGFKHGRWVDKTDESLILTGKQVDNYKRANKKGITHEVHQTQKNFSLVNKGNSSNQ